ncbi:MAG: toll/interleukin-1 receptor domain-containing protein [Fimbriimonadaceae bacterium]|nr:toll/interleukin-1 receptor domain-containing protein [Fimbriimonadaceae bacterium]
MTKPEQAGRGGGPPSVISNKVEAQRDDAVFISHASEDAQLAKCFSELLKNVSAGNLNVYLSSSKKEGEGIPYGDDWFKWIYEHIDKSQYVVAIITKASVGRPWILFEAGLGKGVKSSSVIGLRFGISGEDAYVGPFTAFQNSASDMDDLKKLCKQLVQGCAKPTDEFLEREVIYFLEKIKQFLEIPPKGEDVKESDAIFQALEEMKRMYRDTVQMPKGSNRRHRFSTLEKSYVFARSLMKQGVEQEIVIAYFISVLKSIDLLATAALLDALVTSSLTHRKAYDILHSNFDLLDDDKLSSMALEMAQSLMTELARTTSEEIPPAPRISPENEANDD